jgi:hypothetical protein
MAGLYKRELSEPSETFRGSAWDNGADPADDQPTPQR